MRKLAAFSLAFGAAALMSCYLLPLRWLGWLGLGCALGAAALLPRRSRAGRRGFLLLLGLAAGFLWFRGWTAVFLAPVDQLDGNTEEVAAVAEDYPVETAYGVRLEVRVERGPGVRTLLYAPPDCAGVQPGDRLRFTARFQAADLRRGESVSYYTSKGIFLLAYADGEAELSRPDRPPLASCPARWARALRESIASVFPEDVSGLVTAVLLGDRYSLSDGDRAALSRAGLSHLTAVSGMHVSFLTGALLALFPGRRRLSAGIAIPALVLYALLVGAGPSVVRAAVMQSALLLAPLLDRESDGPTSLGLAALCLLTVNPYAAASISLQLSFAAVAGIFLVTGPLQKRLKALYPKRSKRLSRKLLRGIVRFVCVSFSTTLGALLFTVPLSALYFGSISLAGIFSNLLALWAVSAVFLLGLAAALAGLLLPWAGTALALAAALPARWILRVAQSLGGLSYAALPLSFPCYRLWLLAVYLILGTGFLLRKQRPRPVLPACLCVLLLCAAIWLTRGASDAALLTVTALDVGQGSSTALMSKGVTALVDCGGNNMDNAGDTAADYFQSLGVSRLDLLVLTHFDGDHFNGVEELFRRMDVAAVAFPDADDPYGRKAALLAWAEAEGARLFPVRELSGAALGAAELTLYPPLGSGASNEEGVIALCSAGDYDVLITGDADSFIEAMLVKYFDLPDIELLVAGHHGSRSSTSAAFLEAVRPETAVISTGYNTYGHPASETLSRLARAGVEICRTDRQGTVTVIIYEGG